jgi:predicted glycosyltransferase
MNVQPRILFYLPDDNRHSAQRYLAIANQLAQDIPNVQQKLITKTLPDATIPSGVEVAILPPDEFSNTKVRANSRRNQRKREEFILDAIFRFQPHLVLVDRVASGINGEILPALRFLKAWSPQTKIVYGMPDVEGSPQTMQVSWQLNGVYELLDQFYDRILFYGQRDLFDPIMAYHMPVSTAVKVVECGYLTSSNASPKFINSTKIKDDTYAILVVVDSEDAILNVNEFFNRSIKEIKSHSSVKLSLLIDSKLTIQQIRIFLTSFEKWQVDAVHFNLSLYHHTFSVFDVPSKQNLNKCGMKNIKGLRL